jgi:DNA-binding transcriptional MocR family regulator
MEYVCYTLSMLKPQDFLILLKIISLKGKDWNMNDLARSLLLSQSEVSKALDRLVFSGLIDEKKRIPALNSLYDILVSSARYFYPVKPGGIQRGVPTAHSAAPLNKKIRSESKYVWPSSEGLERGESIEPLYKSVPLAALEDKNLYELLALVDALRVGKAREQKLAREELKKRFDSVKF